MRALVIDLRVCAREFTIALLFNLDENHPPAQNERGISRPSNSSGSRRRARSEEKVKTSSGLKFSGKAVVDVKFLVACTIPPQLDHAMKNGARDRRSDAAPLLRTVLMAERLFARS